ncbi:hypothetical protein HaLaN_29548 [Haematococcus lacustris]|uniref:Uncharacterized protein n=1 Tax=Haematococcus lacustris TaxID=44745 RepID=A0A6A0ACU5_HAELA|nr:hypothetical protein HaLaN_29548 [Haematococcus lacustris]
MLPAWNTLHTVVCAKPVRAERLVGAGVTARERLFVQAAMQPLASHMRVQLPPLCACNSGASCYDPHYTTRCACARSTPPSQDYLGIGHKQCASCQP